MYLFKILLANKNAEFSVIGVANIAKQSVKFQGLLNGIPFTQGDDYEKVRARVLRAVELNKPETNKDLS